MPHSQANQAVLAVRAQDYVQHVTPRPFIGLPREELERLHGAIEVVVHDGTDARFLPLSAYAVIHYNYVWLTGLDGPGSLGKRVPLHANAEPPLFLDDALHAHAREELEDAGLPSAPSDWRCAGLIHHASQLALVYIVRLRQRWTEDPATPHLRVVSNGELQTERASYDALAQHLIDNLPAL